MRTAIWTFCLVLCLILPVEATIQEPSTGVEFPDSIAIGDVKAACTGVDLRTKFFFKIYAIAHYADAFAWPSNEGASERLQHWRHANVAKAFVLTFTYPVPCDKIRDAWDDGLNNANYQGSHRAALLAIFKDDLKVGDQLRFIAQPGGALSVEQNGKSIGSINDSDLVIALWSIWMGEKSVAAVKENLVARDPGQGKSGP